jgi:chemotaxis methyl-accepting protein methylase
MDSKAASIFSSPAGLPLGRLIYRGVSRTRPRSQSLATTFFRNIRQLGVLEGPLADVLQGPSPRILVAACSLGCEPWTLAGYLKHRVGLTNFSVLAVDIDEAAVNATNTGIYGAAQLPLESVRERAGDLMDAMFTPINDQLRIRDDLRRHVRAHQGDVLSQDFAALGQFDLVLGQNFMIHMGEAMARQAFAALAARVRPGGAMFAAGVDLDLRMKEAKRLSLTPVDWRVEAIHEEDHVRRGAWPFTYWSLEPYDRKAADTVRRYTTVYRTPA